VRSRKDPFWRSATPIGYPAQGAPQQVFPPPP
jgi:hypothetical protein